MIMLEAKGIEKVYKTNFQEYPVLNNVNLTVHEGDFVGIMGPSGSGKSTHFKCAFLS